ncbi:MAG: lytic transglycosylase domain-containing protein [Veillonella sp.]|nr:lytic transglycosylase domain-containing protein [Veillonella sp.]MCF0155715.1 lytic transglycosylase domain-containing protein [Veillonella sp.]
MKTKTWFAWGAIVLGLYYWHYGEPYLAKHWAYPYGHQHLIQRASQDEEVPSSLVHAIILVESKYQEGAESERGALGLMQLMPDTAHWIAEQLDIKDLSDEHLRHPETNIRLGTWYIGYLLKEFHGNKVLALAAYNAGRGHVESWMEERGWDYNFSDVEAIPFPETRKYVENVMKYEERYDSLYGDHR